VSDHTDAAESASHATRTKVTVALVASPKHVDGVLDAVPFIDYDLDVARALPLRTIATVTQLPDWLVNGHEAKQDHGEPADKHDLR
jgi:hypothetical protein